MWDCDALSLAARFVCVPSAQLWIAKLFISAEESLRVGFGCCVIYAALPIRLSANQIFDTAPNSNRRRVTFWSVVDALLL